MAYLLGDLLQFTDVEGAEVCGIAPAAFRQRLARARKVMRSIVADRCWLIRAENPCRCSKLVEASIEFGITTRQSPTYAHHPGAPSPIPADTVERAAAELDVAEAVATVFRSDPEWLAPEQVWSKLQPALPTLVPPS